VCIYIYVYIYIYIGLLDLGLLSLSLIDLKFIGAWVYYPSAWLIYILLGLVLLSFAEPTYI
jgi:hypothetical protein